MTANTKTIGIKMTI